MFRLLFYEKPQNKVQSLLSQWGQDTRFFAIKFGSFGNLSYICSEITKMITRIPL